MKEYVFKNLFLSYFFRLIFLDYCTRFSNLEILHRHHFNELKLFHWISIFPSIFRDLKLFPTIFGLKIFVPIFWCKM